MSQSWHQQHPARGILARLTATNVHVVAVTPVVGERHYRWSCEQQERLEAARRAFVAAQFGRREALPLGATFADLTDGDTIRRYVEFDATVASVADVLAERFGAPGRFGIPTHSGVSAADTANRLWKAEQERAAGEELAA